MLTAKGKYALKALIYLSTLEPGEKAQGLAVANAGNIPKKFLDAILGELRVAGRRWSMPKRNLGAAICWRRHQAISKFARSCVRSTGRSHPSPAPAARP